MGGRRVAMGSTHVGGRRVAMGSTHVGGRHVAMGSTYGGPGRCNGEYLSGLPQLKEISFKMTITLGGGININCIYYTIFWKAFCLTFCQSPSPYQDSHMQICCGSAGGPEHCNSEYLWGAGPTPSCKTTELYVQDEVSTVRKRDVLEVANL